MITFERVKLGRPRKIGGCELHGKLHMRTSLKGHRVCRVCVAASGRKCYAKNREKILAHKRLSYQRKKAA